jgi:hypothetical protein
MHTQQQNQNQGRCITYAYCTKYFLQKRNYVYKVLWQSSVHQYCVSLSLGNAHPKIMKPRNLYKRCLCNKSFLLKTNCLYKNVMAKRYVVSLSLGNAHANNATKEFVQNKPMAQINSQQHVIMYTKCYGKAVCFNIV